MGWGRGGVMPALCTEQERQDLEAHMAGAAAETNPCLLSHQMKSYRPLEGSREERGLQGQIGKTCYNNGAELSYHHHRSKVVISYVVTQR